MRQPPSIATASAASGWAQQTAPSVVSSSKRLVCVSGIARSAGHFGPALELVGPSPVRIVGTAGWSLDATASSGYGRARRRGDRHGGSFVGQREVDRFTHGEGGSFLLGGVPAFGSVSLSRGCEDLVG
jgi:hypothetical protein